MGYLTNQSLKDVIYEEGMTLELEFTEKYKEEEVEEQEDE